MSFRSLADWFLERAGLDFKKHAPPSDNYPFTRLSFLSLPPSVPGSVPPSNLTLKITVSHGTLDRGGFIVTPSLACSLCRARNITSVIFLIVMMSGRFFCFFVRETARRFPSRPVDVYLSASLW